MDPSLDLAQIHPVTDFVRNYKSYLSRIKETRKPEVLTVNGVAACVLVDAKTCQEMQAAWEKACVVKAVNQGIESMRAGAGQPNAQAFAEIRETLGL